MKKNILLCLMMASSFFLAHGQQLAKPNISWFKAAKFGLFLHWGLYSQAGGDWNGHPYKGGEHFMLYERIPLKTYAGIANDFNPTSFNADAWVKQAKQVGMKYIVYTTKHHDGFAMYNSTASNYNVVNRTPFKRDPLSELASACQKYDVKLCLYYSLGRDWQDPDVPTNWPVKAGRSNPWDYPNEDAKVFSRYFERKVKPQVKELLTNYGPIAAMWFDTPEMISKNESKELREMIGKMQPNCLVNNRIGNGYGDYSITEQSLDPSSKKTWEACITIGKNWSYNKYDTTFKSSAMLVRNLIDVVANNGSLLLNVGPMGNGAFPSWAVKRLDSISVWMKTNGEGIFDSKPFETTSEGYVKEIIATDNNNMKDAVHDATPKSTHPDMFFTTKDHTVYVFLRDWDDQKLLIKSLRHTVVKNVTLLGAKKTITWQSLGEGLAVELPADFKKTNQLPIYTLKVEL